MKHGIILATLGCVLVGVGVAERGWMLTLVWLGGDFLLLGIAQGMDAHNIFGKRPTGELPMWSRLLFLPLLMVNHIVWHRGAGGKKSGLEHEREQRSKELPM